MSIEVRERESEDEHDDKENIEDRDEIVAISDLKLEEKKLVAVNEGDNLADMEIVEERGLRGEYRW